jgi:ATP-dependent protease ClpP protease subunit
MLTPLLAALPPLLMLHGEITARSVDPLVTFFNAAAATSAITLDLDSEGGFDIPGFALLDAMNAARARGVRITCIARQSASMAAIVYEGGCDVRKMHADGSLLFHEAAYTLLVSMPGNRLTETRLAALHASLHVDDAREADLIAARLHMTPTQYLAWVAGEDRELTAKQALSAGYIDEVIP